MKSALWLSKLNIENDKQPRTSLCKNRINTWITLSSHPDQKSANKIQRQGMQYEQRLNKGSFQTGREILTNECLMRKTSNNINNTSKTYLK